MSNKILIQMKKVQLFTVLLSVVGLETIAQQPNPNPVVEYHVVHDRNTQDPSGNSYMHLGGDEVQLLHGYGASPVTTQFSHIKIDPDAIAPIPDNIDAPITQSDFDNHTIDPSLAVGYTPGSHNVSQTGAATYTVPIQLPPGTNGMVPSLTIQYNSQAGNGILGMGWSLGGLSAIMRESKKIYNNDKLEGIRLNENDFYALDGNTLVSISGTYGQNGCVYGTEDETFSKITSNGNHEGSGPLSFTVNTKDGRVFQYGGTPDSRFMSEDLDGNGQPDAIIAYRVSRISDQNGNYVDFEYVNEDRQSRISRIVYSGNLVENVTPYNVIQFYYQHRSDNNEVFIAGSSVKSEVLLRKISITADGSHFKNYVFDYGVRQYSFLKSITEYGANGEQLNPTVFKYGEPAAQEILATENDILTGENVDVFTGDFNGDGLTDIVTAVKEELEFYTRHTALKLYLNWGESNGLYYSNIYLTRDLSMHYYQVQETGFWYNLKGFGVGDCAGDGKDNLMVIDLEDDEGIRMNKVLIYEWNHAVWPNLNESFVATEYDPPVANASTLQSNNLFYSGDFNGDGIIDYLSSVGSDAVTDFDGDGVITMVDVQEWFNSAGSMISYLSFLGTNDQNVLVDGSGVTPDNSLAIINPNDLVLIVDHNGDGKHDVMVVSDIGTNIYGFEYSEGATTNNPTLLYSGSFPTKSDDIFLGDFNGDIKTDLLTRDENGTWGLSRSNGIDYNASEPFSFARTPQFLSSEIGNLALQSILVADYNGDGKSDVLHAAGNIEPDISNITETFIDIYYSTGTDFILSEHTISGILDHFKPRSGDFDGDGRVDIWSRPEQSDPVKIFYFNKQGKELLLEGITDGIGRSVEYEYGTLSQEDAGGSYGFYWDLIGPADEYPLSGFSGALTVVKQRWMSTGVGSQTQEKYLYKQARLHRQGKGFLGFKEISVVGQDNTLSIYDLDPITYTSLLQFHSSSLKGTTTDYTYNEAIDLGGRYLILPSSETVQSSVSNSTTTLTFDTYDPFANPTKTTSTNGQETIITTTTYTSINNWHADSRVLNKTEQVITTSDSYSSLTVHTYYGNGNIESITTNANSQQKSVTTEYDYDSFGNVIAETVSGSEFETRQLGYEYDSKGRFPEKITNVLGQERSVTYDNRWGEPLVNLDVNGIETSFEYDGFGRLKSSTNELGLTAFTERHWDVGSPSDPVYYTTTTTPGASPITIWYDSFGRERKRQTLGFGGETITTLSAYNELGQLISSVSPHNGGSGVETILGYDLYGRLQSKTTPVGTTSYIHSSSAGFMTTTVNSPGLPSRSTTVDLNGKTTQASDQGGTIVFNYWASGNPKSVTIGSDELASMLYDEAGFQLNLVDLNSGTTEYVHDALGQLKEQTDDNGNHIVMTYDVSGRITSRSGSDNVVTYQYVNSGNGLNQAKLITMDNGTEQEFTYDEFSRPSSITERVDGKEFVTSFTYDQFGRIKYMVYPSGFTVTKSYDTYGNLETVSSNGTTVFTTNEVNANGQLKAFTLGNGKTTIKSFTELGLLEDLYTEGILEFFHHFEPETGNLDWKSNDMDQFVEDFTYDGLNRLTDAEVIDAPPQASSVQDMHVEYFPNGNIDEKSDAGVYDYMDDKIHAVKSITNPNVTISQETQILTYTDYGRRTKSIFEGVYYTTFTYGPDNERKMMELTEGGQFKLRRYYAGQFEELELANGDVYQLHYINGGDGLCAIYVTLNGSSGEFFYVYKDHLGSILKLTDEDGDVVFTQDFDSWGRQRNPENWSYDLASFVQPTIDPDVPDPSVWLSRGFTGHEHLPQHALINMNGRMYDPVQGRMLAPDNFIQDPFSTQSYNRYSYAWNNPMVYVDPNGELVWFAPIIIGAVVGAAVNIIAQGLAGNLENASFGEIVGYAAVGAVAGAATAGLGIVVSGAIGIGGVAGGAISGAVSGAGGGFITGAGNTLVQGGDFGDAVGNGIYGAVIGTVTGAAIGGVIGGVHAGANGRNIWNGQQVAPGRNVWSLNNSPVTTSKPIGAASPPEISTTQPKGGWDRSYTSQSSSVYNNRVVVNPDGSKVVIKIPSDYKVTPANNGNGWNYQPPGSEGNANLIRIMGPTDYAPNGYAVFYNSAGQPFDPNTGRTLSKAVWHFLFP
jgi:RHS repeat-associated protein